MIEEVKQYLKEELEKLKDVYDIISHCSDNDIIGCVSETLNISREEAVEKLGGYRTVAWKDDEHYTFEVDDKLYRYALDIDNDDPDVYTINRSVETSEYYYLLKSDDDYKDFIYDLENDVLKEVLEIKPYMYYNYEDGGIYGSEEYVEYLDGEELSLYPLSDECTKDETDEIDGAWASLIVWKD